MTDKPTGPTIDEYMKANDIAQITRIPAEMVIEGRDQYSVVIGDNRWFADSVAEAVEKASG